MFCSGYLHTHSHIHQSLVFWISLAQIWPFVSSNERSFLTSHNHSVTSFIHVGRSLSLFDQSTLDNAHCSVRKRWSFSAYYTSTLTKSTWVFEKSSFHVFRLSSIPLINEVGFCQSSDTSLVENSAKEENIRKWLIISLSHFDYVFDWCQLSYIFVLYHSAVCRHCIHLSKRSDTLRDSFAILTYKTCSLVRSAAEHWRSSRTLSSLAFATMCLWVWVL